MEVGRVLDNRKVILLVILKGTIGYLLTIHEDVGINMSFLGHEVNLDGHFHVFDLLWTFATVLVGRAVFTFIN